MDPFNSEENQYANKSTHQTLGVWEQGLTPKTLTLLDVGHQSARQPTVPIAASLPASSLGSPDTSSNPSSPSESWFSENASAAQSPSTAPHIAPTQKRIALHDSEQVAKMPDPMRLFYGTSPSHPRFNTSTKKFAQAAALPKYPELALPTRGTSTSCTADQVNQLFAMCNVYPEMIQGVLSSLSVVPGTPIRSLGETSATSSTAMDSGPYAGPPAINLASGHGGTVPEFGFDPLSGTGFVNKITLPNTVSLLFSGTSSAPSHQSRGGPQANTTPTNWLEIFGPPLIMPLSPYDVDPNCFPTGKKINDYCDFLLKARLQADLHLRANSKKRTTEMYLQLLGEAKRNEISCPLYQDQTIGTLGTLFNSNKSPQGVPQPAPIRITDPRKMYCAHNTKQGVKNTKGMWTSLEKNSPAEYHFWCNKAIQIDQEQLRQLLKGFVYMASTPSDPESKPQRRYVLPSEQQMLNRVALFQRVLQGSSNASDSAQTDATGLVQPLPVVYSDGCLLDGVPDLNFQGSDANEAIGLIPASPVVDLAGTLVNNMPDSNFQDSTGFVVSDAVPAMPLNQTSMDFLNWFQNPFGLPGNSAGLPTMNEIQPTQQPVTFPTDGISVPNWVDILFSMSSGYTGIGGASQVVNPTASEENVSTDETNSRSLSAIPMGLDAWTNPSLSAPTGYSPFTGIVQPTYPSLPQAPLTFFSPTRKLHMMQQALLAKACTPLKPGTPEFEKLFMEAVEYAKNNPIYEDKKIVYLHFYIFNPNAMKIPQKVKIRPAIARDIYFQCYGRRALTIDTWRKMKAADTKEYQEWMERAGNLSQEILEQIKRGYIYDDIGSKMPTVRSQPRYRMDDEDEQRPAKVARTSNM
ncbi:unnamed protein product [Caenorhabditis brenneri]